MRSMHLTAVLAAFLLAALLMPAGALAKAKQYQVTGKVLEVNDTMIVVQKADEKWEIDRTSDTKIDGELKVGAKVTIGGYAQSNARVSTLMRNIEASPWLTNPELIEIKLVPAPGVPASRELKINEFTLNFQIRRAAPTEVAAPKGAPAAPAPAKAPAKAAAPATDRPA